MFEIKQNYLIISVILASITMHSIYTLNKCMLTWTE